jgi:murein tripeptide amidase MpaA
MCAFGSFVVWTWVLIVATHEAMSYAFTQKLVRRSWRSMATSVSISDSFDGGNILFQGQKGSTVLLEIKSDPFTKLENQRHSQYFCFRSLCSRDDDDDELEEEITYVITNAGNSSFPKAWLGFTVFSAPTLNDPFAWERVQSTTYDEKSGRLAWSFSRSGFFAYFPPYSYNRHLDLVAKCGNHVISLGKSLEGRDIDCIRIGKGEKVCWIIHRQHPGESMAEYFAEGLLERLLGINGSRDGLATTLLAQYTFYIVPNMCPDGSVHGYLRTNAGGQNLNREWAPSGTYDAPTLQRSPEVYHVWNKMTEIGVDAFLDVHGDEELPFNFLAGSEGVSHVWGPRLRALHGAFVASYSRANMDMQAVYGYAPPSDSIHDDNNNDASVALERIASNQIAKRFDCFSATLEMPFKDCATHPDPSRGWSPARAKQLGASALDALAYVYPYLRDDDEFWRRLPKQDEYVRPTPDYT